MKFLARGFSRIQRVGAQSNSIFVRRQNQRDFFAKKIAVGLATTSSRKVTCQATFCHGFKSKHLSRGFVSLGMGNVVVLVLALLFVLQVHFLNLASRGAVFWKAVLKVLRVLRSSI